jgi:hypothetical protein
MAERVYRITMAHGSAGKSRECREGKGIVMVCSDPGRGKASEVAVRPKMVKHICIQNINEY